MVVDSSDRGSSVELAFKIVAVGALVALGWHYAGLIGLVLTSPAIGLAFSRNLIEAWVKVVGALRKRAFEGDVRVYRFGYIQVRMIMRHGRPWFTASDVCEALGYDDVPDAIRNLAAGEWEGVGGRQESYLSEGAVEKLARRSRHGDAARFGVWFERDVMFPIRRARVATKEAGHPR
jgi:hypothetical protein